MPNPGLTCIGAVLAGLLPWAAPAAAQSEAALAAAAERLIGTWSTPSLMTQAPGNANVTAYVRQVVVFTRATEEVRTEAFTDEALKQPIFVYSSIGPYRLIGPSAVVEGAYDAELTNDRAEVTIFVDAPEIWGALNLASCPLEIGVAVDIRTCADGPPFLVGDCTDLDLIHVDDTASRLRFGAQGTDRCVQRPATLDDVAFVRQPG